MSGADVELGEGGAAAKAAAEAKDVQPTRDLGRVWKKKEEPSGVETVCFGFILSLLAIILPPVSVWLQKRHLGKLLAFERERRAKTAAERYNWDYERCKRNLNINLALTLFGWIGGSIHALVCLREFPWPIGSN